MKQKRVYELEGAKEHARFKEIRPIAVVGIRVLCKEVVTASDRALPLAKAKLDGYLDAYSNLERASLFAVTGRNDDYTVVTIFDFYGPILSVKSRRKDN